LLGKQNLKRKSKLQLEKALPAHNQKMREAAAANAKNRRNQKPPKRPKYTSEEVENLPRSNVKLTQKQIMEIDRKKAADRGRFTQDQRDKMEQKRRDMEMRDRKENALMQRQLQRIIQQSKDCGDDDSSVPCKKMRTTFDLDGDGKMTLVEMKKKTKDMMGEMRATSQRKTFREPPPSRDRPEMPRSPTKAELKMRDLANIERKKQALASKSDRNSNDGDRPRPRSPTKEELKLREVLQNRKRDSEAGMPDKNSNDGDRAVKRAPTPPPSRPPSRKEAMKRRDLIENRKRKQMDLARRAMSDRNSNDGDRANRNINEASPDGEA